MKKPLQELTIAEHSILYPPTSSRGKFHNIRVHARKVMKEANVPKHCKICEYKNYVEVCHIRAICNFTNEETIADVNSLSNLVYLCPNHHWEFDNGILEKLD